MRGACVATGPLAKGARELRRPDDQRAAKLLIFDTQFLVFNKQFLVFNAQFIIITHTCTPSSL